MNKGKPSHTLFELNLRPIKYTLFLDRVYLFSLFVVVVSFFVLVFIVDFFVSFRYSQHIIHSIYAENTLCKCMVGLFLIFNRCGVLTGKIYLKPYDVVWLVFFVAKYTLSQVIYKTCIHVCLRDRAGVNVSITIIWM